MNSNYDSSLIVAGTKDHIGLVFQYNLGRNIDYVLTGHRDVIVKKNF